jgi:hypothetical protein
MPGFHSLVDVRHPQPSYIACWDAEFFCASVLPDFERNLCDGKREKMLRGIDLHLNNAPAHNAQRSRQEISRIKATRAVHPAYSPDAVPSNFFVFDYLKGEMPDFTTNSPADILSEIRHIFQEISKETFVAVYDEWITRLEWITELKGEHHHTE